MSKKKLWVPHHEFVIPQHMLPTPQGRFESVGQIIRNMKPEQRVAIADAYKRHVRSKGGAA